MSLPPVVTYTFTAWLLLLVTDRETPPDGCVPVPTCTWRDAHAPIASASNATMMILIRESPPARECNTERCKWCAYRASAHAVDIRRGGHESIRGDRAAPSEPLLSSVDPILSRALLEADRRRERGVDDRVGI